MIMSGIVSLLSAGEAIISTMLLAAGFIFLMTGISRHLRYGDEPESDERSNKIGAYGITCAWLTGLFFMTGLFWLDYLDLLRLGTQNALALSVVILALSAVIYQAYLFRKGDVE
jgi:hypothetical protein